MDKSAYRLCQQTKSVIFCDMPMKRKMLLAFKSSLAHAISWLESKVIPELECVIADWNEHDFGWFQHGHYMQ